MMDTYSDSLTLVRRAVLEVAIELARLDHRLFQVSRSLAQPADALEMAAERLPTTPAVQLQGVIGAVKRDLQEDVEVLLRAAQTDAVALRREFLREPRA
jgi:hypothetical protein